MRLGQGFNSYTQQICIDDAVVINNDRAENTLLNDGTTMRILIQSQAKPSAWTRQREVVVDDRTIGLEKEPLHALPETDLDLDSDEDIATEAEETSELGEEPTIEDGTTEDISDNQDKTPQEEESSVPSGDEQPVDEDEDDEAIDNQIVGEEGGVDEVATSEDPTYPMAEGAKSKKEALGKSNAQDKKTSEDKTRALKPSYSTSNKVPVSKSRVRSSSTGTRRTSGFERPFKSAQAKAAGATITLTKNSATTAGQHQQSPGWKKLQDRLAARKAAQVKAELEDLEALRQAEKKRLQEQQKLQAEIEKETRAEDRIRREEDRAEQRKMRENKRKFEEERRAQMHQAIKDASSAKSKALTMEEMKAVLKQNQFAERWNGMGENAQESVFDASAPRGPSQTVTYTSRFVDRLSDITDDMCISGALSIKAAKIGGSGRGSFIDSDKFKNSDLTFYVSVKVINQTINFKDALEYKPMKGVKDNFTKIYGDSFISGFLEGGEFNAVVSMKILNKAKKTDIQAEAKVAFTSGPMSVEAEANVGIARENIESNTETTIQVSWCGGGHIKPLDQQWDIKSLMQAAARFPDLVADCPQRTYAILTKYDNLRTFIARQPQGYTKLQYENAQIYTNVLMDSFMSYKALYKRISDQIFQINQKTMEIVSSDKKGENISTAKPNNQQVPPLGARENDKQDGFYPFVDDRSPFEASIAGLDEARKAIRRQMARIVNEVDAIEEDPRLATDEDHHEPFQSATAFETRLPIVEVPERLRPRQIPLTGSRILAKVQSEEEKIQEAKNFEDACPLYNKTELMEPYEAAAFAKCIESDPSLGDHMQVTGAMGDKEKGIAFNTLEFVREGWHVQSITVKVSQGMVRAITVEYTNGLTVQKGLSSMGKAFKLGSFAPGERVVTCVIETGVWVSSPKESTNILALRLYTNRSRSLLAEARESIPTGDRSAIKDGFEYKNISVTTTDCPLLGGTLKAFFGRTDDADDVVRLGAIWGDILPEVSSTTSVNAGKVERRILPSKWGQTSTADLKTHKARFGITYSVAPEVILGFSEVRGVNKAPRPITWQLIVPATASTEGMTYKIDYSPEASEIQELTHSWMTLPKNEVNFNSGTHNFDGDIIDDAPNGSGSHQVIFSKPYKTVPAKPAVWCVDMDYTGNKSPGINHNARLRARVEALTTTGFTLIVETFDGSTHSGNVWGWCVWDKEYDGVKVKADTISFTNSEPTKGNLRNWDPDFGDKRPVSIMTGVRGFDINVSDGGRFHIKSQYQGELENGYISYGVDATASARWMEAMYLAILEN
ncbi:hypothetical protein FIE12Z_10881 [Fusarium flagelliforme]|uniref:H-type lectin domain-containing protein n=1 Tax=Fusarium flagelliforme TaxID=2675880 RepID=A0A395MAQ7_9HYPO|nr:hypothetical protein FIE12Z_10881 [Fusarium flagelliforme]